MASGGLRQLTERERALIGRYSKQHGTVFGLEQPIDDSTGGIGSPLVRLTTLARLERQGAITARELAAGERFHALFQHAALDGLRAADLSRSLAGSAAFAGTPPSHQRCRASVANTLTSLGGTTALPGSCLWHVVGLEWTVAKWSAEIAGIHAHEGRGILIASLVFLAKITRGGAAKRTSL